MILIGPVNLRFGALLIGDDTLQADRERWKGKAIMPDIVGKDISDLEVLRALLYESTPVIISVAEGGGPITLDVELMRFPYAIHSAKGSVVYGSATGFACFALRLVPLSGRIAAVELDDESSVGVSKLVVETGRRLSAEFGNGKLRFDLYISPGPHGLGTLQPPRSYKPEVMIDDENSID